MPGTIDENGVTATSSLDELRRQLEIQQLTIEHLRNNCTLLLQQLAEVTTEVNSDPLTNLYNRKFALAQIELMDRSRDNTGVIFFDLDDFKPVNDEISHDTGDKCLQLAAETLKNGERKGDFLVRWAGDEFLLIIPNATEAIVGKIKDRIHSNFIKANKESELVSEIRKSIPGWQLSVSMGSSIKIAEDKDMTLMMVINNADQAMYEHKNRKKNG